MLKLEKGKLVLDGIIKKVTIERTPSGDEFDDEIRLTNLIIGDAGVEFTTDIKNECRSYNTQSTLRVQIEAKDDGDSEIIEISRSDKFHTVSITFMAVDFTVVGKSKKGEEFKEKTVSTLTLPDSMSLDIVPFLTAKKYLISVIDACI